MSTRRVLVVMITALACGMALSGPTPAADASPASLAATATPATTAVSAPSGATPAAPHADGKKKCKHGKNGRKNGKKGKRGRTCKKAPTPPPAPTPVPASLAVLSTGSRVLQAGQNFEVRGSSTGLAGKPVYLQKGSGTTFSSLAGTIVLPDGTWSFAAPATQGGANQQLRVLAPATTSSTEAVTGVGAFTVYAPYPLKSLKLVQTSASGSYAPAKVSGTTYAESYRWSRRYADETAYRDAWDLSRACTTLTAVVGLDDSSTASSRWNATVRADDVVKQSLTNVAFGTATQISIDVTGALRLNLDVQRVTNDGGYSYLALGNPQVLCAF